MSVIPPLCSFKRFSSLAYIPALLLTVSTAVHASTTVYSEQGKLFKGARKVTTLGAGLFGDKVNLYTGSLEFVQTDVSLPGNSALPVAVGRRLATEKDANYGLFGNWDLEIPHLHGIYSDRGWVNLSGSGANRCSAFSEPMSATGAQGGTWTGTEFWHGSFLYIPGAGDQELLHRSGNNLAPNNDVNAYSLVTRNKWQIRCLPAMDPRNGVAGEAFLAIAPDGTTYQFDWLVQRGAPTLTKTSAAPDPSARAFSPEAESVSGSRLRPESEALWAGDSGSGGYFLARREVWILPTKVTDRFGNTVVYTYNQANPWQLQSIVANDAAGSPRSISFEYAPAATSTSSYRISAVSDGARRWTYTYGSGTDANTLHTVTLPDQSKWQLAGLFPLSSEFQYAEGAGSCEVAGTVISSPVTGTVVHPSGAIGTFVLSPVKHGLVGVTNDCKYLVDGSNFPIHSKFFDTFALTKKTISGPGLPSMEWTTSYSEAKYSWAPWDGRDGNKQVEVRNPEGNLTRYTYGTVFRSTEGQLQMTEQLDANRNVLRSTALRYRDLGRAGSSDQRRGDGEMAARVFEVDRREIVQQNTTFTWEVGTFNNFDQPTQVTRTRVGAGSRTESTEYENNMAKWVLGQVKKVTEANKVKVENTYDAATNLEKVIRFGQPERMMTYYADGTLATQTDNLGHATTYSNYKRGTPQNVAFADGATASAVVNNIGGIDSFTDGSGATSTFEYDDMGRFKFIHYPVNDSTNWTSTKFQFEQIGSWDYDLEPGHWRQTISTGDAVEVNYMDAFWRPIYSERRDSRDPANTQRITRQQYDSDGHPTFQSYPVRNYGQISDGVRNEYDALGRLITTYSNSELGELATSNWYNPSTFQKVSKNARGIETIYEFEAFDQPSEDAIALIRAPEGVQVRIERDVYGKPTSITRSGGSQSLTRKYVYDANERLCKTIEPETKATIQAYDLASNIKWRATGLDLQTEVCDNDSGVVPEARKTVFAYDARNRLKTTTYGDGSPSISRTYTGDGLPETVTSNGAEWRYEYDKRRLNTKETLTYGGQTYTIGRKYDANGSLAQLDYPLNALSLMFNPNALGEARQVGGYATGIQYHPNGAVSSFKYGNGIVRTLKQNTRGLPERSTDAGVIDEQYSYDGNGNVTKIEDLLEGLATRTMDHYDGLDRLKSVQAPNLWGTASYDYDALDNLISSTISSGANARSLTHTINPATNRLDSVTGGSAAFSFSYLYDSQGNITRRGTQTYTFDQANRMKAANDRSYAYDGLGRRVSTIGTDGGNIIQIYAQDGKLLYSGPPGSSGTKYIYLNNHVIAEVK